MKVDWKDWFYYDETSPSCLRRVKDSMQISGKFSKWRKDSPVGSIDAYGYFCLKFGDRAAKCHRVVWEIHNGEIPEGMCIDHLNGVRTDNRISNLRVVEKKTNSRNRGIDSANRSGTVGVHFTNRTGSTGNSLCSWGASWTNLEGKKLSKSFSTNKFGEELAYFLAEEYRDLMIRKLNLLGAGYSERHGT